MNKARPHRPRTPVIMLTAVKAAPSAPNIAPLTPNAVAPLPEPTPSPIPPVLHFSYRILLLIAFLGFL